MSIHPALAVAVGRRPPEALWIGGVWALFLLVCGLYALFAFDYFISFALGREGLWLRAMAWSVRDDFAFGAGSVHLDQQQPYRQALPFMLMHTTMAAVAMAIGPFQFMRGLRARKPALHRALGKIYLLAELVSMLGGMTYLALTGLDHVYTGAPFAIGLWGLNVMVLVTAALAYRAIRRGEVAQHRAWLAYNFGLLLTAPGLRILWVAYGLAFPDWTQADTNLPITTYLLPWCAMVGLVWLAGEALRQPASLTMTDKPRARAVLAVLGAGCLALLLNQYGLRFYWPTDLFAGYASPAQAAVEQAAFSAHAWVFGLYIVAMAGVLLLGPRVLTNTECLRERSHAYFAACALAALGGIGLGLAGGEEALGGRAIPSYWVGLGVLWLCGLGLVLLGRRRGAWQLVRDWAVFSYGIALAPLLWFSSVPFWRFCLGLAPDAAYVTGAIAGFAGTFILAHAANVAALSKERP